MATLTNTIELVTDVIDAFKVKFPMLSSMATDFSNEQARLGDTVRGRILSTPAVADYDATNGYKATDAGANANTLSSDVSVTLNKHKHVPVKVDYIEQISTRRNLYNEVVNEMAYALGKDMTDYVLGLATQTSVPHEVALGAAGTTNTANADFDALVNANKVLTANGASATGRFGIVNSDVFAYIESDQRVSSGDYHGQLRQGSGYGVLTNIAGFDAVYEYPSLPDVETTAGTSDGLRGLFMERRGVVLASRVPTDMDQIARSLGVPSIASSNVVSDADTGLSFLNITYQDPHTFDLYTTTTLIYGAIMGANTAGDNSLLSKGIVRLCNDPQSSGDFTNTIVNYGAA